MSLILVVDDEFDVTETVRAVLCEEGYEVETCENGREALEFLKRSRPALILMDVMMPFMSGLEALQIIRAREGGDEIPVILMSSVAPYSSKDSDAGSRRPAWQWFLRKPFGYNELLDSVMKFAPPPEPFVESKR